MIRGSCTRHVVGDGKLSELLGECLSNLTDPLKRHGIREHCRLRTYTGTAAQDLLSLCCVFRN